MALCCSWLGCAATGAAQSHRLRPRQVSAVHPMRRSDNDMFSLADCFRPRLRCLNRKMEPESDTGTVHFRSDYGNSENATIRARLSAEAMSKAVSSMVAVLSVRTSLPPENLKQFGCQVRPKSDQSRIKVGSHSDQGDEIEYPEH